MIQSNRTPARTASRRPWLSLGLAGAAVFILAGSAVAQDSPGQAAAKARHDKFREMGKAFKAISDQVKTDTPDMTVVKTSAATVKTLSTQLPAWFPAGSGPADGVKTRAKAEVWTQGADFAKAADAFKLQAAKLETVAGGPLDLAALRGQFKATGATCGACHDKFRAPEDH
jgi:cytochrome c556